MKEFTDALGYIIIGFALGYVWDPLWQLAKKIWSEAKKAREEW